MARETDGKNAAIQLLRAVAALTVAAGHIAFAFANNLPGGLGIAPGDGSAGQIAVMLFFIVSGYVMVLASGRHFGKPQARGLFWRRRFIRIMPPYWIATGLLAAVLVFMFHRPINPDHVIRSLALMPDWPADGSRRPLVYLWVGWTLLYEMAFYFIFGLFLGWPRARAITAVTATIAAVTVVGQMVTPADPALFALTRPLPVMFVLGMGLAVWREGGGRFPALMRWAVLAAVMPVLVLVPTPSVPSASGWDYLVWAGLPAVLIALAALGGPLRLPVETFVNRAGDASYAVYLLHVPVAWFWLWFWGRLPGFDAGPWDYLASALAATLLLGWLFHAYVERPMTLALNRRFAAPHSGEKIHRKTP